MSQQLRASLCGVKLQQRPSAARPLARVPARRSSVSVQAVQASPVPPVWRDAPEPKGTSRPSVNAPPAPASTSAASSIASIANVRTSSTTAPAPADAPAVGGSKAKTYEALKTLFTDGVENGGSVDDDNKCGVFINREGDLVNVMCCDYGFRSGAGRLYQSSDGRIPCGALELAFANFGKELQALRQSFRFDEYSDISSAQPKSSMLGSFGRWVGGGVVQGISALDKALESGNVLRKLEAKDVPDEVKDKATGSLLNDCSQIRNRLKQLKLSNHAVWERERLREATGGGVETPLVVKVVYYALCIFLDVMFDNRPIQRFWFLETVARMPYFSYISMLHLYESLGWWRAGAELRKVHFAEEWNEMHHLQIMESLGGDQLWFDRFLGQHAAIVYYWILVAMFLLAPNLAYNFSELIEAHAVDTYGEFVDANEELLKQLPPPLVAATYYSSGDLYMFDEFQTSRHVEPRRPSCSTLYDVFSNIRDDEGEHVKTMRACQDTSIIKDLVARREQGRSI